jgi:hypothetical protein
MTVEVTPAPTQQTPKRSLLRRIGCGILLVFWFALLLVPCFCLVMATNQEIVIPTGSLPGQHLRIWLIMEVDQRGLGISTANVVQSDENTACLETYNRFLLWQGQGDNVSFCECYARESADQAWSLMSMDEGTCRVETG